MEEQVKTLVERNENQTPAAGPLRSAGDQTGNLFSGRAAWPIFAEKLGKPFGKPTTYQLTKLFWPSIPTPPEAEEAQTHINKLEDQAVWQAAQARNTAQAYRNYLLAFPNGLFADDAGRELDKLTAPEPEVFPKKEPQKKTSARKIPVQKPTGFKTTQQKKLSVGLILAALLLFIIWKAWPADDILNVEKRNGKYGFIKNNGETVISFSYDFAEDFSEGLANVSKGGKDGFIDKNGNVVIPLIYDDVYAFSEGLALVEKKEKCGFINKSGGNSYSFDL